jgi:hypothetical protein
MPNDSQTLRHLREEAEQKIGRLEARAGRGLWALALFIALSTAAWRGFDLFPSLSGRARAALGAAPSADLISLALVVYSFSAIVLVLGRMAAGARASGGFLHLAYLCGFYLFYHLAGAMKGNFWAVLAAGVTIIGLEGYHLWTHCAEQIRREKEVVAALERRERRLAGGGT